jgi:pyruvate,water dikinase
VDGREDVFFLTTAELEELLDGTAMFPHQLRALISLRRQAHRELGARRLPDQMLLAQGEFPCDDGTGAGESPEPHGDSGRVLTGLSACGGQAEGRAVVLRDLSEATRLQAGDVLVTRQTDPGWGPVFFLIRGLVLERGGMLSHGAIIAREFGIPAIVGVAGATSRIATGRRVSVNGDTGHVELLD